MSHKVYVNGLEITRLKNNSYFEFPCAPGEYSIQVGNYKETYMRLPVEEGKTYFIRFGFRTGTWSAIPELILVDSISAYPTVYQGNMRNLNITPVEARPKGRLGISFGLGGGFASIPVVKINDNKESNISFGGGFVFGFKYGYELSKYFDLAFDACYQFSSLSPTINNGDVTFKRWIFSLTPSLIIPISDGETMRIKLGAGIDGYVENSLNFHLSKISGGFSEDWSYKNTAGYHVSVIFEMNASSNWSFNYGLKWYTVSYSFESGGLHYPTDNNLKEPNGSGIDLVVGIYYHF
ncbi:MAG: DUF2846 domain-containing protein [Bacteroidales bacterium]